jgi:hypothetical protein
MITGKAQPRITLDLDQQNLRHSQSSLLGKCRFQVRRTRLHKHDEAARYTTEPSIHSTYSGCTVDTERFRDTIDIL